MWKACEDQTIGFVPSLRSSSTERRSTLAEQTTPAGLEFYDASATVGSARGPVWLNWQFAKVARGENCIQLTISKFVNLVLEMNLAMPCSCSDSENGSPALKMVDKLNEQKRMGNQPVEHPADLLP